MIVTVSFRPFIFPLKSIIQYIMEKFYTFFVKSEGWSIEFLRVFCAYSINVKMDWQK